LWARGDWRERGGGWGDHKKGGIQKRRKVRLTLIKETKVWHFGGGGVRRVRRVIIGVQGKGRYEEKETTGGKSIREKRFVKQENS